MKGPRVVHGSVDAVRRGKVYGWSCVRGQRDPIEVELLIDNLVVARQLASQFREDLQQAGISGGYAAFIFDIPKQFLDGRYHTVTVRTCSTEVVLNGSGHVVHVAAPLDVDEFRRGQTWLDADEWLFEEELSRLTTKEALTETETLNLRQFRRDGYIVLPSAISDQLIDGVLHDLDRLWKERPYLLTQSAGEPPQPVKSVVNEMQYRARSARYLYFHNLSSSAAAILTHPSIVRFVKLYFGEQIAGMQSLLFENGTQQRAHQDFPYVHSLRPAALAGAWLALEDVHEDAGPLFYYTGSHRAIGLYTFDDGSVLADGDGEHIRWYENYLESTCKELGLTPKTLLAKKGDVLIWHAALVHGGSSRINGSLTRRSFVCHYTTKSAYLIDRRFPELHPVAIHRGDCTYFANQSNGHLEGQFKINERGANKC
jgi:phytanoyl-CoA hydroxylase